MGEADGLAAVLRSVRLEPSSRISPAVCSVEMAGGVLIRGQPASLGYSRLLPLLLHLLLLALGTRLLCAACLSMHQRCLMLRCWGGCKCPSLAVSTSAAVLFACSYARSPKLLLP